MHIVYTENMHPMFDYCFTHGTILLVLFLCQTSLMLFTADENTDRYLCCGLIPNSKAAKKDTNKWVQVWGIGSVVL